MGGKQKRAAKLKRWKEFKSFQDQFQEAKGSSASQQSCRDRFQDSSGSERSEESSNLCPSQENGHGSGDHLNEDDMYQIRMEILRQRQKKKRNNQKLNFKWVTKWLNRFAKAFDHWPKWPIVACISLVSFVGFFFLLRNLIQLFLPYDSIGIDRTPAYTSLKEFLPRPIYKTIVLADYLLTSASLSWNKMMYIVYPPEERYAPRRGLPR